MFFPEQVHVEVAPPADPLLALLDGRGRRESQQARAVGEDAHHPRAALIHYADSAADHSVTRAV